MCSYMVCGHLVVRQPHLYSHPEEVGSVQKQVHSGDCNVESLGGKKVRHTLFHDVLYICLCVLIYRPVYSVNI